MWLCWGDAGRKRARRCARRRGGVRAETRRGASRGAGGVLPILLKLARYKWLQRVTKEVIRGYNDLRKGPFVSVYKWVT